MSDGSTNWGSAIMLILQGWLFLLQKLEQTYFQPELSRNERGTFEYARGRHHCKIARREVDDLCKGEWKVARCKKSWAIITNFWGEILPFYRGSSWSVCSSCCCICLRCQWLFINDRTLRWFVEAQRLTSYLASLDFQHIWSKYDQRHNIPCFIFKNDCIPQNSLLRGIKSESGEITTEDISRYCFEVKFCILHNLKKKKTHVAQIVDCHPSGLCWLHHLPVGWGNQECWIWLFSKVLSP